MKSREAHGLRALLSTRKALLKKTMDLANAVRGLLKIFGVRLPRTVKHSSFDGLVRPMIEMDEVLAHAIIPLLDARAVLFQHYLELDRRVKRAASQDEVCMRMMTVPGVGPIAALTFKAAVDDAPAWQIRDHEYRSGQSVHVHRVHQDARGRRHPDQHGWQKCVARQGFYRAAVAHAQIRGGLSSRLRQRLGRARKPGPISDVLQHVQTAFIAGRANSRSGISQTAAAIPGRGITEREIHLRNGSKLFKATEPLLLRMSGGKIIYSSSIGEIDLSPKSSNLPPY